MNGKSQNERSDTRRHKKVIGESSRLREELNRTTADFISTELDLALTFCSIAGSTEDRAKFERNLENAQRARDAARKYSAELKRKGEPYPPSIDEKLGELEQLLVPLQEQSSLNQT
jgi:hypothetical protein